MVKMIKWPLKKPLRIGQILRIAAEKSIVALAAALFCFPFLCFLTPLREQIGMQLPTEPMKSILNYNSNAYKTLATTIEELKHDAKELHLMPRRMQELFSDEEGGIVCQRDRDDQRTCIARQYFGRMKQLLLDSPRENTNPVQPDIEDRQLQVLMKVLALHWTIPSAGADPTADAQCYEDHYSAIRRFHGVSKLKNFPPALPFLFQGRSLRQKLEDPSYAVNVRNGKEMYGELMKLCAHQDDYVVAILTALQLQNQNFLVVRLTGKVAEKRGCSVVKFLEDNPAIQSIYMCSFNRMKKGILTDREQSE